MSFREGFSQQLLPPPPWTPSVGVLRELGCRTRGPRAACVGAREQVRGSGPGGGPLPGLLALRAGRPKVPSSCRVGDRPDRAPAARRVTGWFNRCHFNLLSYGVVFTQEEVTEVSPGLRLLC